jgi:hypothetical protein
MNNQVLPHEKEVRARLLPHNCWYQGDVKTARVKLGIPDVGFTSVGDALRWWLDHTETHDAGDFVCTECDQHFTKRGTHCGKKVVRQWYQGKLDDPNRWEMYRRYTFWRFDPTKKQVPLYSVALEITDNYNLPRWAFFVTVWYILTGKIVVQQKNIELLPYPPPYKPREFRYPVWRINDDGYTTIEVVVDEYMTQQGWQEVWLAVKEARNELRRQTGVKLSSRKRGVSEKWNAQIKRWLDWLEISVDHKDPEKIADIWQKDHPKELFTAEAVRNALKQLKEMMKPKKI